MTIAPDNGCLIEVGASGVARIRVPTDRPLGPQGKCCDQPSAVRDSACREHGERRHGSHHHGYDDHRGHLPHMRATLGTLRDDDIGDCFGASDFYFSVSST